MFFKLFFLFALIPVIEIAILVKIGGYIGFWYTVLLVISTAVIGAYLVRREGLSIMLRFQQSANEGRLPTEEIFDGAMVLVSGALLLTPGLVTDSFGFLLVFPLTRKILKNFLRSYVQSYVQSRVITIKPQDYKRE